jgi:hypothetical protein
MSKSKAAIVIYARLEGLGWRRGSVIISRNGQAKTGYMRVSKKEYRIATASVREAIQRCGRDRSARMC